MRILGGLLIATALVGCAPTMPDSGAGVGFDNYDSYEAQRSARDAALRGQRGPIMGPITGPSASFPGSQTTASAAPGAISGDELRAAGLPAAEPTTTMPLPPASQSAAGQAISGPGVGAAEVDLNNPAISDEQDFKAVTARETIQSDKERLAAQREAYRVIQPSALPTRSGSEGPNIVQYALNSQNDVGQQVYSRSGFRAEAKFNRACAGYASSDLAQIDFLAHGGPERDSKGVDPDGDGFACFWDPRPFRAGLN